MKKLFFLSLLYGFEKLKTGPIFTFHKLILPDLTMTAKEISRLEFGNLFLKYRNRFTIIACSYVRDNVVAEDIVSECFANFWENRENIELSNIPEAYILQSVKNRCLNHLRNTATKMKAHQEMQDSYRMVMADIEILENDDPDTSFRKDIAEIMKNVLDSLPRQSKEIFCDSRFGAMTYTEIAEKHNVSPRKVKYEIQSTLRKLRSALQDYLPFTAVMLMMPYLAEMFRMD